MYYVIACNVHSCGYSSIYSYCLIFSQNNLLTHTGRVCEVLSLTVLQDVATTDNQLCKLSAFALMCLKSYDIVFLAAYIAHTAFCLQT